MRKDILREAAGYLARDRRRRIWKKAVGALACAVVFCTVYALILPAITLEKTPQCGKTEHTHSEACYTQAAAESRRIPAVSYTHLDVYKRQSYMEQAEQIAGAVSSAQSLDVDAITGATLTSDTVLKAIENALEKDGKPSDGK